MIRAETDTDWLLVTHPDHAHLAGEFADAWGNAQFARPEPYDLIRHAVYHHDDGWLARDAAPSLTPAGKPEAFTSALVGAYSAFEEIDLPSYLQVRARATAEAAQDHPGAAVLISMHTVNLLTEQADLESIRPEHRAAHADFIAEQRAFQQHSMARLGLDPAAMQYGFEFLQGCDNLSLIACSGYATPRALRQRHPDQSGVRRELIATPVAPATWSIAPWPFRTADLTFTVPRRSVPKAACTDLAAFRAAFAEASVESVTIRLRPA